MLQLQFWKKRVSLALAAAMIAGMCAAGAPADTARGAAAANGFVRVAENGALALDFNPATAEVAVTDAASGAVWRSNPEDRETDDIAKGMKKQDLHAQLLVEYADAQNKPFQLNNYTGSIRENAFAWKRVEGGVEVEFRFPKAGFTIPVTYRLTDDAFSAAIAADRVEQTGEYGIVTIGLLPLFGAGSIRDDGYLFVPDGSGALIRFNNGKNMYRSYNERVYGGDEAIASPGQTRLAEKIRLPVFGIKRNGAAALAVIREGAYQAGVAGEVSRKNNQYNAVWSYLAMTEFETNKVMEGSPSEKSVVRASASSAGAASFEVRYFFLSGEKADYAGMAERYREYLAEEQGVKPAAPAGGEQIPLLIELLGGVKKRETFLGIPYRTVEALTDYDDVASIASRLQERGIRNLSIRYEGWTAGGMKDRVPASLKAERKLGGERGFRELLRDLEARGVAFYPVVDPVGLYRNGSGFHKFFDAVRSISRAPALKYRYLVSNGTRDRDAAPWYLLKPESVREAVERIGAAAQAKGLTRLALEQIGSIVYSDFRRETLAKNETGRIWEDSLRSISGRVQGLSLDAANAYALGAAEHVADVPLASSGFDVADESVPFYSIAISGLRPAFGEPINLKGDARRYMLKLLETGTYPSYRFIAGDASRLVGTEFDGLYGGGFDDWLDTAAAQYEELNDSLKSVMGQPIVDHEKVAEGAYRTTFANGKTVVVNYSEETVTVGRDRIEPGGYRLQ
ncbi:DUF5696 domain-containing protein [Paenibacillus sp.]|uniref:DUF5696 domain-containing protein n=1 Tax=Paenibacillus sp. TaxID=58172 RepID=UPI002D5BC614|nr:DUF5696 domain-containing protein [Paenibacillus sp.]HZG85817.1 DUF5696 domain-containing protein [Paenibacillus sp.]